MEYNNHEDYDHSNEQLVPVYDGDRLIYVTPPEYYRRFLGRKAFEIEREQDGTETEL